MARSAKTKKRHKKRPLGRRLASEEVSWIETKVAEKGWTKEDFYTAYKSTTNRAQDPRRQLQRILNSECPITPAVRVNVAKTLGVPIETLDANLKACVDAPAESPKEKIPETIQKLLDGAEKLADEDRFADAIPILENALQAATKAKHHTAEGLVHLRLGHALFEAKEDSTKAESHFRNALRLAKEQPSLLRHSALHGLGDMLLWSGRLDEAGAVVHTSLEVAKSLGKQDAVGRSLISLGLLERHLGHAEAANSHFDDAIRIFHQLSLTMKDKERRENSHALAVCYQNKAQLECDDGRLEEALHLYAKVEELHRDSGDKLNTGKLQLLLGKLRCANADPEEGFRCFKRAIAVFAELKNPLWMARVYECFARLYAQHERWEETLKPALAAIDGFNQAGHSGEQAAALLFAARLAGEYYEWGERENVRRQIHDISKRVPKEKEAEVMAGVTAQMTRVHDEIAEKVRKHPDIRALLEQAKALAVKEQLHKELAECWLTEVHLLTRKENKEERRQFTENAIAALKKAVEATNVPKRRGHLMGKLSALYFDLGKKTEATSYLRRTGEIFKHAGDVFGLANFHGSMAEMQRSGGSLEGEIASYRKVLELIEGRSFHRLAAGTRINLAAALRFRRDFEEAQVLLTEAEAICEQHHMKDFIAAIARNRSDIETEINAGQAASQTLPQLLGSLHQLLRYKPDSAIAYLAFWYFAWKTELMALMRSGPRISVMIVTDDVSRFMAFAEKFNNLADHFLMATTKEPTVAAERGVLAIPPSWRFPLSFPLLFRKKANLGDGESVEGQHDEPDDSLPNVHLSGPATMLPLYFPVAVPSDVKGEGHFSALATPYVPAEAIELMIQRPVKELILRRAVWFPSPRFNSKDVFLTDLRVAHERGLYPVYFDRLPNSDSVTSIGGVKIPIPASALSTNGFPSGEEWKRALLRLIRLQKDQVQAALLDLPETFSNTGNSETASYLEVYLFEFTEIGRKVIHPVLLIR